MPRTFVARSDNYAKRSKKQNILLTILNLPLLQGQEGWLVNAENSMCLMVT